MAEQSSGLGHDEQHAFLYLFPRDCPRSVPREGERDAGEPAGAETHVQCPDTPGCDDEVVSLDVVYEAATAANLGRVELQHATLTQGPHDDRP